MTPRHRITTRRLRLAGLLAVLPRALLAACDGGPTNRLHDGPIDGPTARRFSRVRHAPLRGCARAADDHVRWQARACGPAPGSLDCPESLPDCAAGERFRSATAVTSAASACRDRLRSQAIDLGAYDSRLSARDLKELRQLLGERRGFRQSNVVATSYGARLALTALQETSADVRSLVLDGALPPQVNALYSAEALDALDQVRGVCAARPACNAAYAGLHRLFEQALQRLEHQPHSLPCGVVISGHRVLDVMRTHLAAGQTSDLPLAMDLVAQGRLDQADALLCLSTWIDWVPPVSGMTIPVMCHDESGQPSSAGRLPAEGVDWPDSFRCASAQYGTQVAAAICSSWLHGQDRLTVPPRVHSTVPTLVTVGQCDPLTPATNATLIRVRLPQAHVVLFGGRGHGLLESDLCMLQVAAALIDQSERAPDTACAPRPGTIDFILP